MPHEPHPELWRKFDYQKASKTSKLCQVLVSKFVSLTIPSKRTNRDAVKQIAMESQIPIESLCDELNSPVFPRSQVIFGFAGDEFDNIAQNYPNIQWWITDAGLNMGTVNPAVSVDGMPEVVGTSVVPDGPWLRSGNAIVSLRKTDGTVLEGIVAQFSAKAVLVFDVATEIHPGDMIVRMLPSGPRVGFVVDDPGYRESIGPIQAHFEIKAHRSAPIDSLEASEFWRSRRAEFEELSRCQRDELGANREHPRWLRGYGSYLYDEQAAAGVLGGLDAELFSKFEDVATQGAIALGCPANADPLEFWTSCLCLDLLQNSPDGNTRELLRPVRDGGIIVDLLGSSAAYCSRLAAQADRGPKKRIAKPQVPEQQLLTNDFVAPQPVVLADVNSAPGNIDAPERSSDQPSYPQAPAFVYQYAIDFPSSGQFAIEDARREANSELENKRVLSYEEHIAAYIEWFWQVVSVVASTIGEIAATEQWSVQRRREVLKDFGLKAAVAARIPSGRHKHLFDSKRWGALNECVLPPPKSVGAPSVVPASAVLPDSARAAKRQRGRPPKISLEAKQKALEAKRNGAKGKEIAQLIYSTKHPSLRQVKDARNVLANYLRSLQRTNNS
jgi:hypothetical protein